MTTKVEQMCLNMIELCTNPKHGYDQTNRWGPDYDCSSAIITAARNAGLPTGSASYTGNMRSHFTANGWKWLTDVSQRKRGDIILNEANHVILYLGNNQAAWFAINEKGTITGGQTGDQTGRESLVGNYYTYSKGWNGILRYDENTSTSTSPGSNSSGNNSSSNTSYSVGSTYTTQVSNLNVRSSAGVTSKNRKSKSQLTKDGQANSNASGQLNKGTRVTCQEVKKIGNDIWIRIPSGWIAAYWDGNLYVK